MTRNTLGAAARELRVQKSMAESRAPLPPVETYALHGFAGGERKLDVPSNAAVDRYVNRFTSRASGRATVSVWLERASLYGPMIEAVLEEYGLPKELLAVALIESGLDPQAVSPAGATGMWQFIGETARSYGLRIVDGLDERRIPELATDAAARHLRDLYDSFGDWPLALAAYNAGELRIRSLCEGAGTTDYWVLRGGAHGLPEETSHYVPKVLAMVTVLRGGAAFGFAKSQPGASEEIAKVSLPPGTNLWRLGKALGLSKARFRRLNPGLVGDYVANLPGAQEVQVPRDREGLVQMLLSDVGDVEAAQTLFSHLARLSEDGQFRSALDDCVLCGRTGHDAENWNTLIEILRTDQRLYRVKSGDSLGRLAKTFGITEEQLRQENNVTNPRAMQVGSLLIVPSG